MYEDKTFPLLGALCEADICPDSGDALRMLSQETKTSVFSNLRYGRTLLKGHGSQIKSLADSEVSDLSGSINDL